MEKAFHGKGPADSGPAIYLLGKGILSSPSLREGEAQSLYKMSDFGRGEKNAPI